LTLPSASICTHTIERLSISLFCVPAVSLLFLSFCWNTMRLKKESFTRTGPSVISFLLSFPWRWVSPVLGSWAVTHTRVHIHNVLAWSQTRVSAQGRKCQGFWEVWKSDDFWTLTFNRFPLRITFPWSFGN